MAQGTQAKVITRPQERAVLEHVRHTRNPERDRVTFLLSLKAGLRAKEIALLNWSMVTDDGGQIDACIALPDHASKGRSGRTVYLHPDLKQALEMLQRISPHTRSDWPVIYSTRPPAIRGSPPRRSKIGSPGSIVPWAWMAALPTPDGAPSSHGPQRKCPMSADPSGTCSNSPDTSRSP